MGVPGSRLAAAVDSVSPRTHLYPQAFSPLMRKNPCVIPVIHTPTSSTSFSIQ
jgi:hypothetical protein